MVMVIDWTAVVTALAGVISGGGISSVFLWRSRRKKANAEADSAAVSAMADALEEIRKSNDFFQGQIEAYRKRTEEQSERLIELTSDNTALKMMVCRHDACPFREPLKGKGGEWFEQHKHDETLTDTESFYTIARKHGYTVKRLPSKPKKGKDNGTEIKEDSEEA